MKYTPTLHLTQMKTNIIYKYCTSSLLPAHAKAVGEHTIGLPAVVSSLQLLNYTYTSCNMCIENEVE